MVDKWKEHNSKPGLQSHASSVQPINIDEERSLSFPLQIHIKQHNNPMQPVCLWPIIFQIQTYTETGPGNLGCMVTLVYFLRHIHLLIIKAPHIYKHKSREQNIEKHK